MRSTKRRGGHLWLPAVCVVIAMAIAVSACGSSSSNSSSTSAAAASGTGTSSQTAATSTASASNVSQPTGSTIKFGIVYTAGNPQQNSTEVLAADRAAVRGINANGGLLGHKLALDECDDHGNPNDTTACGRQMVKDKVAAVMGGILVNGDVLTPVLKAAGIPQIGIVPYSSVEFNSPNVYLFTGGGIFLYEAMGAYLGANKLPTSLVDLGGPAEQAFIQATEGAMKTTGASFAKIVSISATQADFSPVVASAGENGSKALMSLLNSQVTPSLFRAAEASGHSFTTYFSTGGNYGPADASKFGGISALDKLQFASPFPPLNSANPVVTEFRNQLAAELKSGDSYAQLNVQDFAGMSGWLSFYALQQMAKAGTLTGSGLTAPGITKALAATKKLKLGGVIPPWTPDTKGPPGLTRVPNTTNYMIGYKNGSQYLITPKPLTVAQFAAGDAKLPAS
jgi:ABC-type branched-subunit amino acid transport system substrate-binding protein